jgi:hypothetical protein
VLRFASRTSVDQSQRPIEAAKEFLVAIIEQGLLLAKARWMGKVWHAPQLMLGSSA